MSFIKIVERNFTRALGRGAFGLGNRVYYALVVLWCHYAALEGCKAGIKGGVQSKLSVRLS